MGRNPLSDDAATVRVTIRLPETLLVRAREIAKRRGVTLSTLIRRLLERAR